MMDRRLTLFAPLFVLALGSAAFERPVIAQNKRVAADTAGRPDSLAQLKARERVGRAHEHARQLLTEAAKYHRAGNGRLEGVRLRLAGNVYLNDLDIPDSALPLFQRARQLARSAGNRWDELNAEYNIRFVQSIRFAPDSAYADSALAFWREARSLVRRHGDRVTEGEVLLRISGFQGSDSSLATRKQATDIARELGERWDNGHSAFGAVGVTYLRRGQLDSAEVYLRESVARARAKRDPEAEGWALNELAAVYGMRGHIDSTLVLFHAARERFRAAGDSEGVSTVLHNISKAQSTLGRTDSVLYYLHQSRKQARQLGLTFVEVNVLRGIGETFLGSRRPDSALVYLRDALRMWPQVPDPRTLALTLGAVGEAQRALGHADSALASLRRSLALHRELAAPDAAASVLGRIAKVHGDAGNRDSALSNFREGLALARDIGARQVEIVLLADLGDLCYKEGGRALAAAVAYYDSAAALRAKVASRVGNDPTKVSYAEQGTDLYEHWVLAWLAREREVGSEASRVAALAAAERGRAQALLEMMRRGPGGDAPNEIVAGGASEVPGADLVREGRDLVGSVRAMAAPALVYVTTRDTLLTWLISPYGEVAVDRQAVPRDSVVELVAVIGEQLGGDEARGRPFRAIEPTIGVAGARGGSHRSGTPRGRRASLARFAASAAVLLPRRLVGRLPSGGELLIVPHGPLALVSFGALPGHLAGARVEAAETLGARYAIRYAPSLTTLRVVTAGASALVPTALRRLNAVGRGALVVGNPSMPVMRTPRGTVRLPALPAAEREGQWVATALGTTPLTGRAATERVVRARMGSAPVIHLATHGLAFSADARVLDSFVALAPDSIRDGAGNGLLTVGEMIEDGPRLTAELVVLSACQTGLGNLKQAEGTVGLQRAFLAKGARSVLVSLWSVSDEATELLMRRFYTHWLDDPDGPSKAEALRRAQADVRQTKGFEHPRYWAAFQLVGAG